MRVHAHGQCAACGANIEPCCSGDTPNDAATAAATNGHAVAPVPRLFPHLFAQLGGEHATVTDDALLFALSQHLDCDYDEARVVLEAAERVGIVEAPGPGLRRLQAIRIERPS